MVGPAARRRRRHPGLVDGRPARGRRAAWSRPGSRSSRSTRPPAPRRRSRRRRQLGGGAVAGGVRTWFGRPALPPCSAHRPPPRSCSRARTSASSRCCAPRRDRRSTGIVFAAWGIGLDARRASSTARCAARLAARCCWAGSAVLTIPVGLAPARGCWPRRSCRPGALCAPVITATAEEVTRRVPERVRGEAMGWHGSALTVGDRARGAPGRRRDRRASARGPGSRSWARSARSWRLAGLAVQQLVQRRAPGLRSGSSSRTSRPARRPPSSRVAAAAAGLSCDPLPRNRELCRPKSS